MHSRDVRIDSYFSLHTDLAVELGTLPEFVTGREYEADLRSNNELVLVRLEEDEGKPFIRIRGTGSGPLFHRVLGVVVHALSVHSDDVRLTRWGD